MYEVEVSRLVRGNAGVPLPAYESIIVMDPPWLSSAVKIREEKKAMTGTIKKIIRQKGFGFIAPDDGSDDVFFHRGSLAPRGQFEDLNEGDTVQFQSRKGDKGPVAFDLKVR
jgi:cold shock protein